MIHVKRSVSEGKQVTCSWYADGLVIGWVKVMIISSSSAIISSVITRGSGCTELGGLCIGTVSAVLKEDSGKKANSKSATLVRRGVWRGCRRFFLCVSDESTGIGIVWIQKRAAHIMKCDNSPCNTSIIAFFYHSFKHLCA